ncbi:MAG: hypothetical protein ACC641_01715 [Acidiferrobacterales bacterium]
MNIRSFNVRQGMQWLSCGWRFWKKDLTLWWLLGLIYVVIVIVLTRVPIIGLLLVYFITPILGASSILAMQKMRSGNIEPSAKPQTLGAKLAAALFSVFGEVDKILVIVGLGTVCLALGMVIQIVGQAIGGSALLSPSGLLELGAEAAMRVISAQLVMDVLISVVVIILALAIPLYVSGKGISESLNGAMTGLTRNIIPIVVFSVILLAPIFTFGLLMQVSFYIGAALVLLISSALIALYLNSIYCVSKLMFH